MLLAPASPIAVLVCRAFLSPRLACRLSWRGAGRDEELFSLSPARIAVAACLLGRWICVCSDCGGLSAYSVGGAIYVGNVLAKLYI